MLYVVVTYKVCVFLASLGTDNEMWLASYVKRIATAGFEANRTTIRSLAYPLAEKLGIKSKFFKEKGIAGQNWLTFFLEKNKYILLLEGWF